VFLLLTPQRDGGTHQFSYEIHGRFSIRRTLASLHRFRCSGCPQAIA
jgi:hypothetical protein